MDWGVQVQTLGTIGLAMLLGGVIGIDRELADKPAGLRTLMLVAGAAALLVTLGDAVVARYAGQMAAPTSPRVTDEMTLIRSDPIRIIEAIVTGVAFLGAGTIIRRGTEEQHVEGLTTAASILFAAAVGISVALEQYVLAVGATLLTLIVLRGLGWLRSRVLP